MNRYRCTDNSLQADPHNIAWNPRSLVESMEKTIWPSYISNVAQYSSIQTQSHSVYKSLCIPSHMTLLRQYGKNLWTFERFHASTQFYRSPNNLWRPSKLSNITIFLATLLWALYRSRAEFDIWCSESDISHNKKKYNYSSNLCK